MASTHSHIPQLWSVTFAYSTIMVNDHTLREDHIYLVKLFERRKSALRDITIHSYGTAVVGVNIIPRNIGRQDGKVSSYLGFLEFL